MAALPNEFIRFATLMKGFMKTSFVITVVALCLLFSRASLAQNGGMMNGGRGDVWMGGYGGILVPGLLVIVVAGLVMWFVKQKGK